MAVKLTNNQKVEWRNNLLFIAQYSYTCFTLYGLAILQFNKIFNSKGGSLFIAYVIILEFHEGIEQL